MSFEHLPISLQLILNSRSDLREIGFHRKAKERQFTQWLLCHGNQEYVSLLRGTRETNSTLAWLAEASSVKGVSRIELAIWDHPDWAPNRHLRKLWKEPSSGLFKYWLRFNWPTGPLKMPSRKAFFDTRAKPNADGKNDCHSTETLRKKNQTKPFGVNLVGYATYALGIAEDLRTTNLALKVAQIPTSIYDFPPGAILDRREHSLGDEISNETPYGMTVLCLTACETARFWLSGGADLMNDTYTIGYWPWELENWPKEWLPIYELVDEIWVSTNHIAISLRPHTDKPLHVMPLCVDSQDAKIGVLSAAERRKTRAIYKLKEKSLQFISVFDLNSHINRKNPWGSIHAFQAAFPVDADTEDLPVGLVIKTFPPTSPNKEWRKLKKAVAADRRITIIEANLSKEDLYRLYGCCDCYVSLHRAEGFGRCLAETLQLGLDVVATNWSGNTDFFHGPLTHKVDYKLVPIPKDHYEFWQGQRWAEPDLNSAVAQLKKVYESRRAKDVDVVKASALHQKTFSAETCAKNYDMRLKEIWEQMN